MPEIPDILVEIQMARPVSASSDRNIRITIGGGPLISVGIFRPKFAVPVLSNRFFAPIREFGKGMKSGWPSFIGKCRSIFLGYSH